MTSGDMICGPLFTWTVIDVVLLLIYLVVGFLIGRAVYKPKEGDKA